jgi:hypothetical protein
VVEAGHATKVQPCERRLEKMRKCRLLCLSFNSSPNNRDKTTRTRSQGFCAPIPKSHTRIRLLSFLQSEKATMEEQQQQNALAAAFPAPPPFWQSFTPENISAISSLRAAQAQSSPSSKFELDPAIELPIRLLDLPAELRCLQPPEPPVEGIYRCFGDLYNVRTYQIHIWRNFEELAAWENEAD